ncbi:MAG TPA: pitrilysin family protein [Longimicrobiaceae bacterium]|nr:pitrilysin family protein [Longimicrobiaceae bacterium]
MSALRRSVRGAALAASLAAGALPAAAQQPVPPAQQPFALPRPAERTLGNGLRVVVAEQADVPLATAQLLVKSGPEADPAGLAGLAEFVVTLAVRGTEARPQAQVVQEVAALGATLTAAADWDAVRLTTTAPASRLPQAAALLAESAMRPALTQRDVELFNEAAARRAYARFGQAPLLGEYAAARVLFGTSEYGHPPMGTQESVQRITRDDVTRFHAAHFRPDNAVLVIAGDVRPDAAFALAERLFGGWARPAGAVPAATRGRPGAPPAQQRVVVIDVPDADEATVTLAAPGVGIADADYFRALVSGAVLGGGYGARLSRAVRVERPLAESLRARVDARRDGGTLFVSTTVPNEAAAEAAALLAAGMARLAAEPATHAELAARRAFLTGTLSREVQTTEGLATLVGMLAARGVPLDRVARFGREMQSVGPRDVRRFGARLAAAKPQVVIVGRADAVLEDARRRFPGVEVVPFDELDLAVGTLRTPQP